MGKKIVISESQYNRVFLNEQDPPTQASKEFVTPLTLGDPPVGSDEWFEQLKEDLLNNWNSMSKLEKMTYILPDHFSDHGWHSENFWSVDYDALPVPIQKLVSYGSSLAQGYDHKPNTEEGKYFEVNAKRIASPEEWMKFYPYTMGKIFDPTNDPNKFKNIKNKWKGADAKSIELLMLGAQDITDFDNFKGDMSTLSKKEMEDHNYWDKYYDDINDRNQERADREHEEWLTWKREDERLRAEANKPLWQKYGFENADDYYNYLQGTGDYSWGAIINDMPTPLRWGVKGYLGMLSVPFAVYDILDCGDLEGFDEEGNIKTDYFHCIMGNASMAVSLVPVLGTIGSAIIDAVDAGIYLGEAAIDNYQGYYYLFTGDVESANEEFKEAAINVGWAGLSALGIIPGVTEAKLVFKSGKGVLKSADNVIKELSEKEIKKITIEQFDNVIHKNTKNLDEKGKKQVMEILNELTNPNIREELIDVATSIEDYNKYVDNFMKSNKITKHQYKVFLNSPDFKTLMKKHGNDFYKAMAHKTTREVLRTFLWQSGIMTIIQGSIWGYNTTKENRLEQDAAKGNIASIVKLAGFDWDLTKEIFESSSSIEDNELLKKAWYEGWTPWGINYETGKGEEKPSESGINYAKDWLIRHPEYQTDTFKEKRKEDISTIVGVEVDAKVLDQKQAEEIKTHHIEFEKTGSEDIEFQKELEEFNRKFNEQKDDIDGSTIEEKMINFMINN
jgi:hypothetical protein